MLAGRFVGTAGVTDPSYRFSFELGYKNFRDRLGVLQGHQTHREKGESEEIV
jgi:hypothetical protein